MASGLAEGVAGNQEARAGDQSVLDGVFEGEGCAAGVSDGGEAAGKDVPTDVCCSVEGYVFVDVPEVLEVAFAGCGREVDVAVC